MPYLSRITLEDIEAAEFVVIAQPGARFAWMANAEPEKCLEYLATVESDLRRIIAGREGHSHEHRPG